MDIQHLGAFDAFADAEAQDADSAPPYQMVHLRRQQRNGRKCITTVQGLSDSLDLRALLSTFKKKFSCNGAIKKDKQGAKVLQLSGDQRQPIRAFLIEKGFAQESAVNIHGA